MTDERAAYTLSNGHLPDAFEAAVFRVFKKLIEATQRVAKKHDCCQACLSQHVFMNWLLNYRVFSHDRQQETFLLAVENLARGLRTGTFDPDALPHTPLAARDTAPGDLH